MPEMSESDVYDDYCEAWPAIDPANAEDKTRTTTVFAISIHVSVTYPPRLATEEDELDIENLVETDGEDRVFEIEYEKLINEEDEEKSRSIVQEMLCSMDVPERPFMVEKILACARSMAIKKSYADYKVLGMKVSISVVSEDGEEEELESDGSDEEEVVAQRPASESAIQELEIVRVGEELRSEQCAICLEEFSCGLETRRLPCSHVYHQHCVVHWLHDRNSCPVCRFKMN